MNTHCSVVVRVDVRFVTAPEKMENNNLEQRHAIKFCVELGDGATDTYKKTKKAFGNDSISRAQVFQWRETVGNEPRSGRPSRLCENKHKRHPCEGFHSSRSTPNNSNHHR
jgi:hypothetical protein